MKLKDKVALVTGSSRGIGKATALEFAKEGAKVAVNYVSNEDKANEVVSEIKKLGSDAVAIKGDVSNEEDVKHMITKVVDTFGKIDILVNNAGVVVDVPFDERTVENWKRTLEVNLIGSFLCCKYAAKHMKDGRIINISSSNGIDSFSPDCLDYDASKAGINIMTRDLAEEFAPSIRVNAIAPGWVDTEMNADLPADYVKDETSKICLKRFADPAEIAKVAVFLVSDDASFVNGSIIKVDGGYSNSK